MNIRKAWHYVVDKILSLFGKEINRGNFENARIMDNLLFMILITPIPLIENVSFQILWTAGVLAIICLFTKRDEPK